jgi:hypothetical protein
MRNVDLPSGASRTAESGLVWEEKITNTTGAIEIPKYSTYRVRATAAATVTVDGILAATLTTGEILVGNVGVGNADDSKNTVTLTIATGSCFVQVGRVVPRKPA